MARKSGSSPFERKKPSLKQQPLVLIICEDTKSSLQYLKDAARHFRAIVEIEKIEKVSIINCGKNDPLNIVKEAIERQRSFDQVYCAIDRDTHEKFDEALVLAKAHKKISVIASYPCYEFWLLLHFKKTRKPYTGLGKNSSSGDLLGKDLRKCEGMESYEKGSSENLFEQLFDKLEKARERAEQVMNEALSDGELNPSTQLHQLIQRFESLGTPQPI
ncbi:MAG: RloB family protein [Polaromonas sp.]|nr:RloB family protein [Polaromonas sp.]